MKAVQLRKICLKSASEELNRAKQNGTRNIKSQRNRNAYIVTCRTYGIMTRSRLQGNKSNWEEMCIPYRILI
jgi:hypothetical protein